MLTSSVLAVVPRTLEWSPTVALIMIICNVVIIALGRSIIKFPNVGPQLPISGLLGLSIPALLATTSLGHIIGTGVILGLHNLGAI